MRPTPGYVRTFDRFEVARGATGWVYQYWNRASVEHGGWISSGLELSVQLRGAWLHAGRWSGRRWIGPGDTFFLSPAELYGHRYCAAAGESGVQVGFLLFPEEHASLRTIDGDLRLVDGPRRDAGLVKLARHVADQVTHGRAFDASDVQGMLLSFVHRHCELVPRDNILVAKKEIERHYDAPLYIHQIAECAGLHAAAFVRGFSARFGVAPARYRLLLRINAAAQLLWAKPTRPHLEIAAQVGFTDESFFYRAFRRITGMTPSQYAARVLLVGEAPQARSSR